MIWKKMNGRSLGNLDANGNPGETSVFPGRRYVCCTIRFPVWRCRCLTAHIFIRIDPTTRWLSEVEDHFRCHEDVRLLEVPAKLIEFDGYDAAELRRKFLRS
jgi:hypothetical protein